MSGGFLRNASKRCLNGVLERQKYSAFDFCGLTEASIVAQKQASRAYARSLRKVKGYGISPAICSSSTSSSWRLAFVRWYLGMIESRPVLTKGVTSGLIYTAADLTSQIVTVSSSESFDTIRTLRMAFYGTIIQGPTLHLWFNFISKVLPKRDVFATLKKILVGQTLFGPVMTAVFFSTNAGLQGETSSEIVSRLKRDLFPTLINGLLYWPMCDFVTFKFTPVRLQPLASNSFSYLWTIYMTYMASLKIAGSD